MIYRLKILSFFIFISFSGICQENCTNGIDDDGDGLIDLQDPDCHCGAGLNARFNNAIPNPGFDQSSCCPQTWWDHLNCVDNWTTDSTGINSSWGLNYISACNGCTYYNSTAYIVPPNCGQGGNNGFLGMAFWNNWANTTWNWNNHANVCLNTPFYPGNTYVLYFDAFNTFNYNWQFTDDTVHFSILGSTSCANIPHTSATCSDPDWTPLDSLDFVVPVDTTWHNFSFTFSPTDTIYAIALGQTCSSWNNNQTYTGWQRLLFDNLVLYDSKEYDLQITETGGVCSPPHILTASIDTTGGTWQWYQDSIALVGQTNTTLDITTLGSGNFTALYILNGTCQGLNLEVSPPVYPLAFISANSAAVCTGDSIYFDGFSFISEGTIDHYYYSFGNGDSAFIEDPVYAFDTPGTYTVEYTAESNLGCTGGQSQTVVVHPKPATSFLTANECLYNPADFTSMTTISSGFIDSLSWNFGDGNLADDSLETHQYANFGNYIVKLFTRSNEGCTDSTEQTISIHAVPSAIYTADSDCENINIAFNNSSSIPSGTIQNYDWNFGDNTFANTANVNHTYVGQANYSTKLVVTSDSGCVDSTTLILEIYPEPVASFSSISSCYLATFTNSSTIGGGSSIVNNNWDFGNTVTSTEENPTHYYSANDTYNVTLETVSNFGCVDDTIIPISIFSNFFADLSPLTNSICVGECAQLYNNSTPTPNQVMKYYWRTSDGQTSTERNPYFCFNQPVNEPTGMDVFFRISTSSGCLDSILVEDAVTVIPIPVADFTFTPEKPESTDPEVTFINQSSLATNYEWNFGNNNFSNEIDPIYTYPSEGKQYTVRLTASDANNTCHDEHSELLIIEDEILFFIPNSFTPNGSGKNDVFSPQFVSGIDIYQFRMQIFNRWGELVFESNDPLGSWDGQYAGQTVTEGVYIWKIDFIEPMVDKTHTHTGTVNVLR